ncbi:hypothetical protein AB1Y20_001761 [Prymnesium parvum]|uniref:WW domain-containing protein n=1 Tax=Prymnesium parvum TaxID=97485 RepID=A0AB34KCA8_PRYPA
MHSGSFSARLDTPPHGRQSGSLCARLDTPTYGRQTGSLSARLDTPPTARLTGSLSARQGTPPAYFPPRTAPADFSRRAAARGPRRDLPKVRCARLQSGATRSRRADLSATDPCCPPLLPPRKPALAPPFVSPPERYAPYRPGYFDVLLPAAAAAGGGVVARTDSMVLVHELLAPAILVPLLTSYADLYAVIDARERAVQAMKGFIASLRYIRGNARRLPTEQLRHSRAKLARLLGRLRAHSTNVVELLLLWRRRREEKEEEGEGGEPQEEPQEGAKSDTPPTYSRESTLLGMRTSRPVAPAEPFFWMGWNYLLKMSQDMRFAPLPVGSDPLLLYWFHYESPRHEAREVALRTPPDPSREAEWWFDAERLHTAADIARMRAAQQARRVCVLCGRGVRKGRLCEGEGEILDEVQRYPQLPQPPSTEEQLRRPQSDVAREAQMLLYGEGGYAEKVGHFQRQQQAVLSIQSMARLRFLRRRLSRRFERRALHAVRVIQYRYRNQQAAKLSSTQNVMASMLVAAQREHKEEQLRLEEDARVTRERQAEAEMRHKVLARRWKAVRSCIAELRAQALSAPVVQCAVRVLRARRKMWQFAQYAKLRRANLTTEHAQRAVRKVQYQMRAYQAATRMLVDQYEERKAWYQDSRSAVLLQPLVSFIKRKRSEICQGVSNVEKLIGQDSLEQIRLELDRATKRIWAIEGEKELLEALQGKPKLDFLMKKRLDNKLIAANLQPRLEKLQTSYENTQRAARYLSEQRQAAQGMIDILDAIRVAQFEYKHGANGMHPIVMLTGQLEALHRKKENLDRRIAKLNVEVMGSHWQLLPMWASYTRATASLELISSIISKQVLVSSETSTESTQQLQVVATQDASTMLSTSAREAEELEARIEQLRASMEPLERLCGERTRLRAALKALRTLYGSGQRTKYTQLARRRTEALGHTITTANAQVAYRDCKKTIAVVAGARELIAQLSSDHAQLPRPTLEVRIQLPGGSQSSTFDDAKVARQLLDDMCMWMGWPDEVLLLAHQKTCKDPAAGSGANWLDVSATLCANNSMPGIEPELIGPVIVDECQSGRMTAALTNTASCLGLASVQILNCRCWIPTREELIAQITPVALVEEEARQELQHCISVAEALEKEQPTKGEESFAEPPRSPSKPSHTPTFFIKPAVTPVNRPVSEAERSDEEPPEPSVDLAHSIEEIEEEDPDGNALMEASEDKADWGSTNPDFSEIEARVGARGSRHGSLSGVDENRVAMACAGALTNLVGMISTMSRPQRPRNRASEGAPKANKLRIAISQMTGHKERALYFRVRIDVLQGKLKALERLRSHERWNGLRFKGSSATVDEAWNMGIHSRGDPSGHFCAFCAQRNPPVLGRHRYVDCVKRLLAGMPEYSVSALEQLTNELMRREMHTERLLAMFQVVVQRRKQCKAVLDETADACHALRKYANPSDSVAPPTQATTRSLQPVCRPRNHTYCHRVRLLSRALADQLFSEQTLAEKLRAIESSSVWSQLKVLFIMSPRRSLIYDGYREMTAEAEGKSLTEPSEESSVDDDDEAAIAAADAVSTSAATPAASAPEAAPVRAKPRLRHMSMSTVLNQNQLNALNGNNARQVTIASLPNPRGQESLPRGQEMGLARRASRYSMGDAGQSQDSFARGPEMGLARRASRYSMGDAGQSQDSFARGPEMGLARRTSRYGMGDAGQSQDSFARGPEMGLARRTSRYGLIDSVQEERGSPFDTKHNYLIEPWHIVRTASDLGIQNIFDGETSPASRRPADEEYHLLPLAIELLTAPIPGGWCEVMENMAGQMTLMFEEEATGNVQLEHPLTPIFRSLLRRERTLPSSPECRSCNWKGPHWLLAAAERKIQFASKSGGSYFYDFSNGSVTDSLSSIVLAAHKVYQSKAEESVPGEVVHALRRGTTMSSQDAAAAATMAQTRALIRKTTQHEVSAQALLKISGRYKAAVKTQLQAERESLVAGYIHKALKRTFYKVMSTALAHEPRAMTLTISVAVAYGIELVKEAEYLWLADLAMSLPVPLGWVKVTRNAQPSFYWYNELLGISQWTHPIDDFIKCTLKALRQPLHATCLPQVRALLGVEHLQPEDLTADGASASSSALPQ